MQPNTENTANTRNTTKYRKRCKYSQRNQIQKTLQILTTQPNTENAANTHNATKYRKRCKYSQRNQIQKTLLILATQPNTENTTNTHNATKYICSMCCKSDGFLNLLVVFQFTYVFFNCSVSSSLGHHSIIGMKCLLFSTELLTGLTHFTCIS